APYGHDGRFFSLMNVFEHYRSKAINSSTTDSLFKNKLPLSNFEIGQLTAFLYTLSDTIFLKDKRFAEPGTENTIPSFIHLH
ncbi:MAG: cytochrome-c peroxidase, partial [Pedobacter sp.]|nr:cytochrome-c peroxidase [Chitinophagaceae bacterium]